MCHILSTWSTCTSETLAFVKVRNKFSNIGISAFSSLASPLFIYSCNGIMGKEVWDIKFWWNLVKFYNSFFLEPGKPPLFLWRSLDVASLVCLSLLTLLHKVELRVKWFTNSVGRFWSEYTCSPKFLLRTSPRGHVSWEVRLKILSNW